MLSGLRCLTCSQPMETLRLRRVEVDRCRACGSMWLDSSELAVLVGSWQDLPRGTAADDEPPQLSCPRCLCPLRRRAYSEHRRTIVDQCPDCDGIWLDGGELDTILSEVYNL